jgi:DNA-binding MarR family transcriptional regulator
MPPHQNYLILDAIDRHRPRNQRELANSCGLSLGKTNSVLRKLLNEGLVKTSDAREDNKKSRKCYVLTTKGIETKAALSGFFIKRRMKEFEDFRKRLLENLLTLQNEGLTSVLVLGSQSVGKLLAHIARGENLDIRIVGTVNDPNIFDLFARESYDSILIAEGPERYRPLLQERQIPEHIVNYIR